MDDIVPSSPPTTGLTDEAGLPDFEQSVSSPFFESRRDASSLKSSSPPPLFSSDDSRESVQITNYESPRIFKNKRKGAWWDTAESVQSTPENKRNKMSRNFDSGIYMMDGASDSLESLVAEHRSPFPLSSDLNNGAEFPPANSSPAGFAPVETPLANSPSAKSLASSTAQAYRVLTRSSSSTSERNPSEWVLRVRRIRKERGLDSRERILDERNNKEGVGGAGSFNRGIRNGLEHNLVHYDFEGHKLEDADIQGVGVLNTLIIPAPNPDIEPPAEGQYSSMIPMIHLNLVDNRLKRLVPAVFEVQQLTTLIIRENQITELPQDIRKLVNLRSLHLGTNRLHTLPYDLIRMMKPKGQLDTPRVIGNPFWLPAYYKDRKRKHPMLSEPFTRPEDWRYCYRYLIDLYASLPYQKSPEATVWAIRVEELYQDIKPVRNLHDLKRFIARTPVAYFDQRGMLEPGSPPSYWGDASMSEEEFAAKCAVIIETERGAYVQIMPESKVTVNNAWFCPQITSGAPSLATLALMTALKARHKDGLSVQDVQGFLREPVLVAEKFFARASENDCNGYGECRRCHTCNKEYVVARAEWIEFWTLSFFSEWVPFLVKVCSWNCVPDRIAKRPERMLNW